MQIIENKALFLDRDGVINKERGKYTFRLEDFIINDGLTEALRLFQDKDYLLIIISNQGGISKGLYTKKDVDILHTFLQQFLSEENISLTDFYYCPHHSDIETCFCRKPSPLLLERAINRYNINRGISYFIGDSDRDIEAGKKAGLNTIKVVPNENLLTNTLIRKLIY